MFAGLLHVITGSALWKIDTVWPATVSVPVRDEPVVFASTLTLTVPEPAPLAPPVTWRNAELLTAFQVHSPLAAVTLTLVGPPAEPTAIGLPGTVAHE